MAARMKRVMGLTDWVSRPQYAGRLERMVRTDMELLERLLVACFDPLNINWAIEAND